MHSPRLGISVNISNTFFSSIKIFLALKNIYKFYTNGWFTLFFILYVQIFFIYFTLSLPLSIYLSNSISSHTQTHTHINYFSLSLSPVFCHPSRIFVHISFKSISNYMSMYLPPLHIYLSIDSSFFLSAHLSVYLKGFRKLSLVLSCLSI